MTKTLTEQWREGTLPFSRYYVKFVDGSIDNITLTSSISLYESEHIKEVLAPVPSYDEWKKLDDELKELATMNDTFAIKNGRLRERLVIAKKAFVDILNDGDDYWDQDYDVWCGKCSSGIKCYIYNLDTEESITFDESYEDVKKLYEVLKQFFENGEKDIKEGVFK